jgi:DivIVA domain-containing protein
MSDTDRTAVLVREAAPPWDLMAPRFPVVRRGYDREAVDDYIAELEQELEDLRAGRAPAGAISAEIERIGEQTVAILRVAHEQASATTRRAQDEADRCLSAAASNAVAMTEEAKAQLRQLDAETDTIWRERARLLEDVRQVATSLSALAEEALDRFPPEAERVPSVSSPVATVPGPVAAPPEADETVLRETVDGGEESVEADPSVTDEPTSEFRPDD